MRALPPSLAILLLIATPAASWAQRTSRAALDSTSARCLAIGWLDAKVTCEGRALNAVSLSMLGAAAGGLAGAVGGALVPTDCLGNAEKSAVRGAIAGAAIGAVAGVVTRHISRRERVARDVRDREAARNAPVRPWSWRDVRPALVTFGAVAATGAAIGAVQGGRTPERCAGGAAGGLGTGAGVFATGAVTTVAGSMLVVRFLF